MTYPEFHHLGFKFLTGFWFYQTIGYMKSSLFLQQKQTELLMSLSEKSKMTEPRT
jgi:hypothetical protein